MINATPEEVIRRWGILGAGLRSATSDRLEIALTALKQIGKAGHDYAVERGKHLENLIERSHLQLAPIGDPIGVNFGLNRWLSADREEAYSDWLAWILQELASGYRVACLLFGAAAAETRLLQFVDRYTVRREVWVPEGHQGRAGRLDCLLTFEGHGVVALELKNGPKRRAIGYRKTRGLPELHVAPRRVPTESYPYRMFR